MIGPPVLRLLKDYGLPSYSDQRPLGNSFRVVHTVSFIPVEDFHIPFDPIRVISVKQVRTYSRDRVIADRKASGNRGPDVRAVKEELVKRTIQNRMFER